MKQLDYYEYVRELYSQNERGYISFYPQNDRCPCCKKLTEKIFSKGIIEYNPEEKDTTKDIHHLVNVNKCICGWWSLHHLKNPDPHNLYSLPNWFTYLRGVLRRFTLNDPELPMEALRIELNKHPKVLDSINSSKMEELVCSVFKDLYPGCICKVCGKSGDGGIDLILVISDESFAIQVKHRQRIDKGEPVNLIRELIGAMVLKEIPNGIYVTTANDFSRQAKDSAKKVLNTKDVHSFRLINRNVFYELLEATASKYSNEINISSPWLKFIPSWFMDTQDDLTPFSLTI